MIEVTPDIWYDPTKAYEKQSIEFIEYSTTWYYTELSAIINDTGYPDFATDGSWTFHIDNGILEADVQRIQVIPHSTSDRRIKESIINITVK